MPPRTLASFNTYNNLGGKESIFLSSNIQELSQKKNNTSIYELIMNMETKFQNINRHFVTDYDRLNPVTKIEAIEEYKYKTEQAMKRSKYAKATKINMLHVTDGVISYLHNRLNYGNNLNNVPVQKNSFIENLEENFSFEINSQYTRQNKSNLYFPTPKKIKTESFFENENGNNYSSKVLNNVQFGKNRPKIKKGS